MTSPTHETADVVAEKAALRAWAGERRDGLRAEAADADRKIADLFLKTWSPPAGAVVSAFWPIRNELDLRPLIRQLSERGCRIGLPVVVAKRTALVFREWKPGTDLVAARFGVSVPPDSAPAVEPDWLLVPLLAFDKDGYRLGYGGGFYDITLAGLRARKSVFAIGTAYDGQEVNRVPRTPDDARLDAILTDKRVLIMEP